MKTLKKLLALALAASLAVSAAVSANAFKGYAEDYAAKGNKYLMTVEGSDETGTTDFKTVCEVDENHKVVKATEYTSDDGTLVPMSQMVITRDAAGNKTSEVSSYYDEEKETFVPQAKNDYEYDANGNISKITDYVLDSEGKYILSFEICYDHNDNGDTTYIIYKYYNDDGQMYYSYGTYFEYDANALLTKETSVLNSVNSTLAEYTYNEKGQKTVVEYFDWDTDKWVKAAKNEFTYSADGLTVTEKDYNWETDKYEEGNNTYTTVYNEQGLVVSNAHYRREGKAWCPCCKYVYTYDEFGNLLTTENYEGDGESDFDFTGKTVRTYGTYEVPMTSPKTADVAPIAVALTSIIALGALVISKKVKA